MQVTDFLSSYNPINGVEAVKVDRIAESLLRDGWVGAPIVVHEGAMVTGSHRYEALRSAGLDYQFDVPTVELADVFAEVDLDLSDAMTDEDSSEAWDSGFVFVLRALPVDTIEKYGIQWG